MKWIVKLRGPYNPDRLAYTRSGTGYPEAEHTVECAHAADAVVVAKCRSAVYENPEWKCVACEPAPEALSQ